MIKYEIEEAYSEPDVTEEELIECYRDDCLYDLILYAEGSELYETEKKARVDFSDKVSSIRRNEDGYYEIMITALFCGEAIMAEDIYEGEKVEFETLDAFNEIDRAPFDSETKELLKELNLE